MEIGECFSGLELHGGSLNAAALGFENQLNPMEYNGFLIMDD